MGIMGSILLLGEPALAQIGPGRTAVISTPPGDSKVYEAGLSAAKAGKYNEAISLWKPLADSGNPVAQNGLALLYRDGRGVAQDYGQALVWYQKAADQGYAPAQCDLGHMYLDGLGVPKDAVTAVAWYRKAAEQGDAMAQNDLGIMYYKGLGVPQDYVLAASWYQKAADQGNAETQHNLGRMYYKGEGVPKDYTAAAAWFEKAGNQGVAQAQTELAFMYNNGEGVAKDPAKALFWYQKAADQGVTVAQYNLGLLYANGQGTPKDFIQAYKWVDLAAINAKEPVVLNAATQTLGRLAQVMTPEQIAEAKKRANDWRPGSTDQAAAQDKCSPENIGSQPYGSCGARTITVPNRGEYATIDMKPAQDTIERLKEAQGSARDAMVADLVAHSDRQIPPILFLVARDYANKGNYNEALFWAHAGFLRSLYDGMRCTDSSSVDGAVVLMRDFAVSMGTHRPTAEQLTQVSTRVLAWDTSTSRNYDQRWLCLHGMEAVSVGLGNPPTHEHIFAPESDWPAILDKAHSIYRTDVDTAVAHLSNPPASPAQPASQSSTSVAH